MTDLRKLAEAATPGPWIAGDDEDSDYFLVGPHDGDEIVFRPVVKLHVQNNAYYIAAANPAAILALLDTIDKQRELLKTALLTIIEYGKDFHPGMESVLVHEITAHLEKKK